MSDAGVPPALDSGTIQRGRSDGVEPSGAGATPAGSERANLDTPDAITVLDRKKIAERNLGQTPDLLGGLPGVYVQHTAAGQGSPFLRGLTGKQVLILIDGVRFNNSTFRFGPNQYLSSINAHLRVPT